jgi:hypothetical protein
MLIGRAIAQAVSCQVLTAEARVSPCEISARKVALGRAFLRILLFPPSVLLDLGFSYSYYLSINNRPVVLCDIKLM